MNNSSFENNIWGKDYIGWWNKGFFRVCKSKSWGFRPFLSRHVFLFLIRHWISGREGRWLLQIFQGIVNIFPKFGSFLLWLIYPRKRRECSFRNMVSYQIFHSFLVNHQWNGSFTLSLFFLCFWSSIPQEARIYPYSNKMFFLQFPYIPLIKRQSHKMVKHAQRSLKKHTIELVMNTGPISFARHDFHYHNVFIVRNCMINLQW